MYVWLLASTTFKREDLSRGFESDECFYFGSNAARVRELIVDKGDIELDVGDPAPDLVVEVDITSPSLDKLPIYARLEVPEVWRYSDGRLTIFELAYEAPTGEELRYAAAPESDFLPGATGEVLTRFVAEGLSLDRRLFRRGVRAWTRGPG